MRFASAILLAVCLFSCSDKKAEDFTDMDVDEKNARLHVVAAFCAPEDFPACRAEDFTGYAAEVELYLFESVEKLELGNYFASCTTGEDGLCVFPAQYPGNYILFSRYEHFVDTQLVRLSGSSTTWEYLTYPDVF